MNYNKAGFGRRHITHQVYGHAVNHELIIDELRNAPEEMTYNLLPSLIIISYFAREHPVSPEFFLIEYYPSPSAAIIIQN